MSRSGFIENEDYDPYAVLSAGRTMGRIASATRGRRGQLFLKKALAALDAMEDKRLAGDTFGVGDGGCMCLMTSIATETGNASAMSDVDLDDGGSVCRAMAVQFDVAKVLVQDLVWTNDASWRETPSMRWKRMRDFISSRIKQNETPKEMSDVSR